MAPQLLFDLVALVGGTVLTFGSGPQDEVQAQVATLLIDGDRISAIAPEIELAPGTIQHDVSGLFLVPGLIDGFVQFDGDNDALYTTAGVTLVRDVGGDRTRLLSMRDNRERVPGPNLLTAGVVLGGDPPSSPDAAIFLNATEAERLLPLLFADQVDFLSVFPNLPGDAWKRSIELGLEHGLGTWGPTSPAMGMGLAACLEAGQAGFFYLDSLLPSEVEWSIVQPLAFKKNIKAVLAAGAGMVPMMRATAQRLDPKLDEAGAQERYFQYLGDHYKNWWESELAMRESVAANNENYLTLGQRVLDKQIKVMGLLHDNGVKLLPGSGSPHAWLMPGVGLVEELEMWQSAGFTASELLYLTTAGASKILGKSEERGRLQVGMLADIACFAKDPRESISNLRGPQMVVVRGQVNTREDLDEMLVELSHTIAERRQRNTTPMKVDPPTTPEGDVVMQGFLETRVAGTRISAERWAVVRETGGALAFCGRVVTPAEGSFLGTDLSVIQRVVDGRLKSFALTLRQEDERLDLNAEWVGERFAISRRVNGAFIDNNRTPERAVAIDIGSVTTPLVLGQLLRTGVVPAFKLHAGFEAEVVGWQFEIAEAGVHMMRSPTGGLVFDFDTKGGPKMLRTIAGDQVAEAFFLEQTAFGGPGLPIPTKEQTYNPAPAEPK